MHSVWAGAGPRLVVAVVLACGLCAWGCEGSAMPPPPVLQMDDPADTVLGSKLSVGRFHNQISKIFYLNLDKDRDRNDYIRNVLSHTHIPFERISAVTFEEVSRGEYDHLLPPEKKWNDAVVPTNPKFGQLKRSVGCDVAHRKAYHRIAQEREGLFLVIEDDVRFEPGWKQKFDIAWSFVPSDWLMARIGFWGEEREDDKVNVHWYRANRHFDEYNHKERYYYGAHAIVLTPERARRLLERVRTFPATFADDYTGVWQTRNVIRESYVMVANIVRSVGFRSSKNEGFVVFGWADVPGIDDDNDGVETKAIGFAAKSIAPPPNAEFQ